MREESSHVKVFSPDFHGSSYLFTAGKRSLVANSGVQSRGLASKCRIGYIFRARGLSTRRFPFLSFSLCNFGRDDDDYIHFFVSVANNKSSISKAQPSEDCHNHSANNSQRER